MKRWQVVAMAVATFVLFVGACAAAWWIWAAEDATSMEKNTIAFGVVIGAMALVLASEALWNTDDQSQSREEGADEYSAHEDDEGGT